METMFLLLVKSIRGMEGTRLPPIPKSNQKIRDKSGQILFANH